MKLKQDQPPSAREIMQVHLQTVTPDMPLAEVVQFLLKHELSSAPVVENVNGQNQLLGFLSERDCLIVLADDSYFGTPSPPQTARTIMRKHPICVSADTDLFSLASIFVSHDFRHLPVTDGKILLGIVSRRDVLRAINEFDSEHLAEQIRRHTPPVITHFVNQHLEVHD